MKKPERIEALGLVLLLSLLKRHLMESSMRKYVDSDKTRPVGLNTIGEIVSLPVPWVGTGTIVYVTDPEGDILES